MISLVSLLRRNRNSLVRTLFYNSSISFPFCSFCIVKSTFCDFSYFPNLLVNEFPVLKADAIKYVMIFRSQVRSCRFLMVWCEVRWSLLTVSVSGQLPKEHLLQAVPLLITHLQAESTVQHTYAAHALERLFTMKGPSNLTLWVSQTQVHAFCFETYQSMELVSNPGFGWSLVPVSERGLFPS